MSLLFNSSWKSIQQAFDIQLKASEMFESKLSTAEMIKRHLSMGDMIRKQPSTAEMIKKHLSMEAMIRKQPNAAEMIKRHLSMEDVIRKHFLSVSEINKLFIPPTSNLIQSYWQRLQTDLECEPDEHEVIEHPETELIVPEARERIVVYSPSILLLEQLRARHISLHDIHWRELEELVAELLTQDGYTVQLGRGTKDDGKDIVAVKSFPRIGLIMSVWQAKKPKPGKPIGISTIRELADTRHEHKASKGVIVTTTSLTEGAMKRVEQDCYWLHKIDGADLDKWIQTGQQP